MQGLYGSVNERQISAYLFHVFIHHMHHIASLLTFTPVRFVVGEPVTIEKTLHCVRVSIVNSITNNLSFTKVTGIRRSISVVYVLF